MSRKRKPPLRKVYPDPKYGSVTISKFINSIMYDGKRSKAEKILYTDKNGQLIEQKYDYIISTMPIKELIESSKSEGKYVFPPDILKIAASLPYRDFITIGLLIKNISVWQIIQSL